MSPEPDLSRVAQNAVVRFKRVRAFLAKSNQVVDTAGQLPRRKPADLSDREPKALADLIDDFGEVTGFSEQLSVTGLSFNWAEIVGPELAQHLTIEDFNENSGKLTLRASSTAWATQVRLLIPQILTRIAEEVGSGVVSDLLIEGPNQPSWKHGKRTVKGRGPRDTYG